MNATLRKVLGVIILAVIAIGVYASIFGIGPVDNLKESLDYGLDIDGGVYVVMQADTGNKSGTELTTTMEQTKEVLNKRVNAMGVSEATVNIEGQNRLRIEMPGVKDAKSAIERIGETAKLRFTLADGTEYLTGDDVKDAVAETDSEHGGYQISMTFTGDGQDKFAEATKLAAGGSVPVTVKDDNGEPVSATSVVIWLDDKILTAPTVEQQINSASCVIYRGDGGYSKEEAMNTAALIRGGALPVSLTEVESSVQTASIGANALDKSIRAGLIGLALVFILMLLMYNVLGLIADIALLLYVMLVLWIMSSIGAVLTLPGIAGIVLGIGMAVDANVIIFSRIKEEIGLGRSIRVAVDQGFRNALTTVLDAQITTLIATVVLYELGSTTVKGFAVTLMIGIIISIFTAVVVSQIFVGILADSKNAKFSWFGCKADGTPKRLVKKSFSFIEHRKKFYIFSAAIIIVGVVMFGVRGFNYGIDFTGGTMIQMDLGNKVEISEVQDSIASFDLDADIVYAGADQKQVIIKTTKALNASERDEVQQAVIKAFNLNDDAVVSSEQFGPTIGKEIRNNAIQSILIAALGMLIYIIIRFRSWKYGVSAVAGIAHDVLIMLSFYAIFHVTVNNPFVAAILTVVGYSINDTIVIFDRVRENRKLYRGEPVVDTLNRSINQTLDRSVMTSMTTLLAIIPLLVLVSTQLAQFVMPLMVGVLTGTYSSIFLCSPLFYEFNKKEEESKYVAQQKARARIESKKAQKSKAQPQASEALPEAADAETAEASESRTAAKKRTKTKGTGGSKSKKKKNRKHH